MAHQKREISAQHTMKMDVTIVWKLKIVDALMDTIFEILIMEHAFPMSVNVMTAY
jgi:hypothetical protein